MPERVETSNDVTQLNVNGTRRSMTVHWVACGECYSKPEGTELGGIIVNRGERFGSSANIKGAHKDAKI